MYCRIAMRQLICINILFVITFFSANSYSWGGLGHRIVCDIAWRDSSSEVKKILSQTAKRMGYKTFADSCVWADRIRKNASYDFLKPLHYINVPVSSSSVKSSQCLVGQKVSQKPRCVITAVDYYATRIRLPSLSQRQRDEALLLMSHFIGDLHQPLHVSYAYDRGGTAKKVIFEGKLLSLHGLWDSTLLYCQPFSADLPRSSSWKTIGRYLWNGGKKPDISVISTYSIISWADESLAMTKSLYRDTDSQRLPNDYCRQYHPLAVERLRLAGFRLARKLEETLAP